jgi:hypothetical protein
MLAYGILRWLDGLNGREDRAIAWNAGHVAFFVAIVLFGILAVRLRGVVRRHSPGRGPAADVAAAAAVFGAACFLWVIGGDLFPDFSDAAPLPEFLDLAGPLLFNLGLLTLLILLVATRPRQLPAWSPVLVLLGFAAIPVSLDLLPVAAILVGIGLAPLAAPALIRTRPE